MKTSTHIFMFPTYFCYWIYLTFKITSTEIQSKTKLNTVGCTPLLKMTSTRETTQAKMMKFMPLLFVLFCYNFGSGLALYWTISNIFTIGQQIIINRMPDHDPLPAGPGVKNVTPAGKRPKQK